MSKHTAGPWRHSRDQFEDWGVVRGGPSDLPIAKCFLRYTDAELQVHRLNGTDPCGPDARLIAAAPELLEACECALTAIIKFDEFPQVLKTTGQLVFATELKVKLKTAIAKATGESK